MQDQIEREIAIKLVDCALAKGYCITVWDEEAIALPRSTNREAILEVLGATGQDQLVFYNGITRIGMILLIWGNGEDLISDATVAPLIDELIDASEASSAISRSHPKA